MKTQPPTLLLFLLFFFLFFNVINGATLISPSLSPSPSPSPSPQTNSTSSSNSTVSAMFILGDSTVNCGNNDVLYNLLHDRSSPYPCLGFETRLLPDLLGNKMGLPMIPPIYLQNGTIEGLVSGLNYGSSQATILNTGNLGFQALNHQMRQLFETIQILQLQLGQTNATDLVQSSLFYISLGKDDYIQLFLHGSFGLRRKYRSHDFAHILVNQMIRVVQNLYNANARKIICVGIGPLGCAPRTMWESYNATNRIGADDRYCNEEINQHVLHYNVMLSEELFELNNKLLDAEIIFCDVYQGMMEIIHNPQLYGFIDVRRACCGIGRYGGMAGCSAKEMACSDPSSHVWWDFYNPTQDVNSLLANWTWSGQPHQLCRPISVQQLASLRTSRKAQRLGAVLIQRTASNST